MGRASDIGWESEDDERDEGVGRGSQRRGTVDREQRETVTQLLLPLVTEGSNPPSGLPVISVAQTLRSWDIFNATLTRVRHVEEFFRR
jgi:hypothetical protein